MERDVVLCKSYGRFDKLKLLGLPDYVNLRQVLSVKVADAVANPVRFYNACGGVLYFLRDAFIEDRRYETQIRGSSSFLLFYGKYNLRKDHQKTFLNFSKCFEDADVIYADFMPKRYHPFRLLMRFFYMLVWLTQMLFNKIPIFEACNSLPYIQLVYELQKQMNKILVKDYRFVVTYYDAAPDENYFTQVSKQKSITTMTLQHGIFARKNEINSITDTAFELSCSISDYYLAWNQYTKDEAIKVGLPSEKIIVLGAPKYINTKEPEKACKAENSTFGVILNNSAFDRHNRCLIDMANDIYDKTGFHYLLRYHPQMNGGEYKELYGRGFLKEDDNSHSILDYANSVSFTIISSSSVFVDLLLLKHPTYRLKVTEEDTYSTVNFNSFSTVDELIKIRETKKDDDSAFNYLCTSYDTYNKYRSFFNSILKK